MLKPDSVKFQVIIGISVWLFT